LFAIAGALHGRPVDGASDTGGTEVASDTANRSSRKDQTMTSRLITFVGAVNSSLGAVKSGLAAAILLGGLLVLGTAPAAAERQPQPGAVDVRLTETGRETFRMYCAACHGTDARGDGPLASSMRRRPPNLTELAKRNGGQYPAALVFRTIDGRQPVRGHGGPDMPVWGDAFMKSQHGGDEAAVKQRIEALVTFLESIQLRTVH
jgi:mono/diheme cytochrome c family protein